MDYSTIFAARANLYRDAQVRWPEIRRAELECFTGLLALQGNERVLDAPAGNGVLRGYLPEGCDYVAQDPAQDFAHACHVQELEVCCAPLRASGLEGQSFDVVASLTGLHHECRREEIYAEWWRVLKPGGRLVAMDVEEGTAVGRFLNGFVDQWNSQGHRGEFLNHADECSLQALGFIEVERLQCEYEWTAADERQMADFMCQLFGLDRQPDASLLAAELAFALDAGMRKGCYRVPWTLTALRARKPVLTGA